MVWTEEDYQRLSAKYPSRIILCDRKKIIDTHNGSTAFKAFKGMVNLHQVNTVGGAVAPGTYEVNLLDRYCVCTHCTIDPKSETCPFAPWKNDRTVQMKSNIHIRRKQARRAERVCVINICEISMTVLNIQPNGAIYISIISPRITHFSPMGCVSIHPPSSYHYHSPPPGLFHSSTIDDRRSLPSRIS